MARIGDNDYIKVGSRPSFTVAKASLLKFGVGISPRCANQSYQFPSEFKVQIVVGGCRDGGRTASLSNAHS